MERRDSGPGCGLWFMWMLTIGVIVLLFVICVVLAFTTRIVVTPTG